MALLKIKELFSAVMSIYFILVIFLLSEKVKIIIYFNFFLIQNINIPKRK